MGHDLCVEQPPEIDRRRVRVGLAILGVVFLVSALLAIAVDDPLGRVVMSALVVVSLVRAFLLIRTIRRGQL
jgi:uncharacterized membrane protein